MTALRFQTGGEHQTAAASLRGERRANFLLQGQLSVLTLISVSVPPPVLPQKHVKLMIPASLPKVQVAGYS